MIKWDELERGFDEDIIIEILSKWRKI